MTRVKVCGVTRPEDALAAAEAGAWAIGLIFARESPRFVDVKRAVAVCDALPKTVLRVGVFRNQSLEVIRRVEEEVPLDLIQLHGRERDEDCRSLGVERCVKAVILHDEASIERALGFSCDFLLADRSRAGPRPGETPVEAHWGLAAKLARRKPKTLLAGGLNPGNVGEAIRSARPWGVDAASGFESAPGVKDHELLRAFMRAVEEADR